VNNYDSRIWIGLGRKHCRVGSHRRAAFAVINRPGSCGKRFIANNPKGCAIKRSIYFDFNK